MTGRTIYIVYKEDNNSPIAAFDSELTARESYPNLDYKICKSILYDQAYEEDISMDDIIFTLSDYMIKNVPGGSGSEYGYDNLYELRVPSLTVKLRYLSDTVSYSDRNPWYPSDYYEKIVVVYDDGSVIDFKDLDLETGKKLLISMDIKPIKINR